MTFGIGASAPQTGSPTRRESVLDVALEVFARFGYRKTSMDDVAAHAHISRPGLYFLFSSKPELFRAATERAIELDLTAAERALTAPDRPLEDRVVHAFDSWAGRYVGPMSDAQTLVADNPALLGPTAVAGPDRFQRMLLEALRGNVREPTAVMQILISVSVGLKHQVTDRAEYNRRLRSASALLLGNADARSIGIAVTTPDAPGDRSERAHAGSATAMSRVAPLPSSQGRLGTPGGGPNAPRRPSPPPTEVGPEKD